MNTPFQTFHDFEHARWQEAADGYDRYWKPLVLQTIAPLLDAAAINENTGLLDVACGPGYAAGMAAERGASVTGIDFSPAMIKKAGVLFPEVRFQTGDAQALPFTDGMFDAVTINFGMLHFERPELALAEAYRVLNPGGRIAYTVWAKPEQAKGFDIVYSAIEKHGSLNAALPPGPPFFRFSDGDESAQALRNAGFVKPERELLPLVWEFTSGGDFLAAFHDGTARTGPLLRAQDPAARAAIHNAILQSLSSHARNNGLQIPMMAVLYHAIKP